MISEHRSGLQGRDFDGERWAAHTQPLDTSENLIVIRSVDGKVILNELDALRLAAWIMRNVRRYRGGAATLIATDDHA
ncbi:MAG: hypothetical protein Q4G35_08250 [Propionibacteriaceae bacterium]|nr:hypothetical protein [Propionibacteriaceae bacterium]